MSGKRNRREDEEHLMKESTAFMKNSAALQLLRAAPSSGSFPQLHLRAIRFWWEGKHI